MANIGYATLSVIASFDGMQRQLERGTAGPLTAAGKSSGKRFGSAFGSAVRGTIAGLGIFTAGSAALRFLGDSVQEGRESIRIGKQTAAVIKSTGGVARISEKQAGRLANTLKRLSGVDDELIQGSENVLLTFKNIRNEQGANNKIFDKATKSSLNLSVALGKDLNSSALLVGKALNDPVAGATALTRAGVQLTAQQKDQIKTAVENGNALKAQKIILRELSDEFRGSARAQRTEADRLSTAFGDFKEEVGTALIPVLDDLATFIRKEGIPRARDFFGVLQDDGVPALKKTYNFAKDAAGEVKGIVDAFRGMPDWVQKILIAGGVGTVAAKKLGVFKAVSSTGLLSKGGTPVNPLYVSVVGGGLPGAGGGLSGGGKNPFTFTIQSAIVSIAAVEGVKGVKTAVDNFKNSPANGSFGIPGLPTIGGSNSNGTTGRTVDPRIDAYFNAIAKGVGKTRIAWLQSKDAAEDYSKYVQQRVPRRYDLVVHGFDEARSDARALIADLLQVRSLMMDTRLDRAGVTDPVAGGGINPTAGTRPHGRPRSAPQIIINGDVRPNDSKQFFGDLQRRAIGSFSTGGY